MATLDQINVRSDAPAAAKAARRSKYRWTILMMLGLMALITFIDRTNISVAAPEIAKEFGFTKTQLGWIFSTFGFAYAHVAGGFSGSVSSVMNMVGQAAGSVSAIIFGALVDHVSWMAPFYVISGVMLGSALLWAFFIDPERLVTERS